MHWSYSFSAVINQIGTKWSLVLSGFMYCVLFGATITEINILIIVAAAVMGVGAGILWTAQGILYSLEFLRPFGSLSFIAWIYLLPHLRDLSDGGCIQLRFGEPLSARGGDGDL